MRDSMLTNYCVFKQLNGMGYRPAICRCLVQGFGSQANDSAFIMAADCDDADRLWLHLSMNPPGEIYLNRGRRTRCTAEGK